MISAAKFPESASLVKRSNWIVVNALSAATLTLATVPSGSFRLAITLSASGTHTDCAGTVIINDTEVLTFAGAGKKTSTTTLTSKPTIKTSNIDCWILITAISTLGADIEQESLTTIDIAFDDTRKGYWNAEGVWTINNSRVQTENTTAIIGDIIRHTAEGDSSIDYIIKYIQRVKSRLAIEEYRILQF